jgi:ADP-ribosylglycohydrolase
MVQLIQDCVLGCIIGGALGDALGSALEGTESTAASAACCEMMWELTDDTQLTLATCEAIIAHGHADPSAIAASFLRWFRSGRLTGLGASTLKALRDLEAGAHWALAGRRGERAAGNGAAMRIAPLAFCTDPHEDESRRLIRDISRITHHSDEAYIGALAVVLAIRAALAGSWSGKGSLIAQLVHQLPDTSVRDRLIAYAELPAGTSVSEAARRYGASGYVVESVPLAIFAAQMIGELGFADMLEQVILAGGDTDTNASLAGQIAGTALGLQRLPADLVARLPQAEMVMEIANEFADTMSGRTG